MARPPVRAHRAVSRAVLVGWLLAAGWSQVAVVLYPSRATFVAMLERPDFRAAAEHKIAGVERTIVLVTSPVEPQPLCEQGRIPQALPLGVRPGIALAVEGELIGDGRSWEELRVNNFPSRATFDRLVAAESLDRAGFEHREAALADTYALLAAPVVSVVGYLP